MKKSICIVLFFLLALNVLAVDADGILKSSGVRAGVIVVIGCDDPDLIIGLQTTETAVVHALDTDPAKVGKARAAIHKAGQYGRLSATTFDGKSLPYGDNLITLIVDPGSSIRKEEAERALAPRGVLITSNPNADGGLAKYTKPVPPEIDDWTHYLYSPSNHAVAEDTVVGPPAHYQWIGKPRFSRSHDHLSSISAVVSANGRLYSIVDEGPIAFAAADPRWKLVARDAFNGIRLWEHDIEKWEYHLRDFRSGPADIARRLVAIGDVVYVTLGYGEPVIAINGATGKTIRTYKGTEGTREILVEGDEMFLVLGKPHESWGAEDAQAIVKQENYVPPFDRLTPPAHSMRIACVSASTGQVKWTNKEPYTRSLMPATLTVADGRVFFHSLDELVCLDAKTGKQEWKTSRPIERKRLAWSSPTVVAYDGIVYAADRGAEHPDGDLLWLPSGGYHEYIKGEWIAGKLIAYDAKTGERLWDCPAYEGFNSAVDIFIIDGLQWTGRYAWRGDPGINEGRDPKTGEVKVTRGAYPMSGHARCHRAKATTDYLIVPGRNVELIDVQSGEWTANRALRGNCAFGILPANGLIYIPPHSCACSASLMSKDGFVAMATARAGRQQSATSAGRESALHKGPAYVDVDDSTVKLAVPSEWPTYRGDSARLGSVRTSVSGKLEQKWASTIGGPLSPPVTADGIILVAAKEQHTVHALDAESGKRLWQFTAGARIDSPPTIITLGAAASQQPENALCIFGSRDGYVYCLRLSDGELAWRYRAAPCDKFIAVDGQLESAWPVSGSVLVERDAAYFVAGRSTYFDGGMVLHKVDATSGKTIKTETLKDSSILPDVLASDGDWVFMRGTVFSKDLQETKQPKQKKGQKGAGKGKAKPIRHLWSSVGFLDHNWWHRTYWLYGPTMGSGFGGWFKEALNVPAGRLLATDGHRIYGYGRTNYDNTGGHVGTDGRHAWGNVRDPYTSYQLFGRDLTKAEAGANWARPSNVLGQALLLTDSVLFVAGPENPLKDTPRHPSAADLMAKAIDADRGGKLLAVSPVDGKTTAEYELRSSPVFDGMIAAEGCLFLSTKSGELICME